MYLGIYVYIILYYIIYLHNINVLDKNSGFLAAQLKIGFLRQLYSH